jgi:formate hydrogenlyase subunit 3/multisubunit Na+/H+ antiporter MnhD subunit
MNAPIIWIALPILVAILVRFIPRRNIIAGIGSGLTFLLGLGALLLPFDAPVALGDLSIKISSTFDVLGRRFSLEPGDTLILAIIYFSATFWLAASHISGAERRLVSIGLLIIALLVASLAVEPFLYAALLIELAVLLSIPLLSPPGEAPSRGAIRFLIFQTLAMPLILFAGWLIAGVEANPGDLTQVGESAILLGLGLMLLLAIFPFFSWIPMLTEETNPYVAGFLFWIFPTLALFFGLRFLDNYAWIRESPELTGFLQGTGSLMVVTGGLWAAFQRHAGRTFGYATIMETGLSLLALSLGNPLNIDLFILLLIPRAISMGLWAFSLSTLKEASDSLRFRDIKGLGRSRPFATLGILFASLSILGFPLLPKFPIILPLWSSVAEQSPTTAIWLAIGLTGLATGIIRILATLVMSSPGTQWKSNETLPQRIFIGLGVLFLFTMGLIPQWVQLFLPRLPGIFEHLGR